MQDYGLITGRSLSPGDWRLHSGSFRSCSTAGKEVTRANFMKDKKTDSLLNHQDKLQRNITPKGRISTSTQ